jgi:hypothetical protein
MVSYSDDDSLPTAHTAYASLHISDETLDKLSNDLLRKLHALSPERARQLSAQGCRLRQELLGSRVGNLIATHSLSEADFENSHAIAQWFAELPIESSRQIYMSWGDKHVIITEWSVFLALWDNLYYPHDSIDIFDNSLSWALMFGPNEQVIFARR